MADYSLNFYEGADYGLQPRYASGSMSPYTGFQLPSGTFGVPSDPRTANQIDAVSRKLSTGAKVIEVSGVNITGGEAMGLIDKIPKQQFQEINRLKKLVGAELTFHGPLVEPTGISRGRWDPQQRIQAEREMWSAVERSHDLDPKGNIVVTFHSSNGLPEPKTLIKDENGKEVVSNIAVINQRTGEFGSFPRQGTDYWNKEKGYSPLSDLKRLNEQNWAQSLSNLTIEARRAEEVIERPIEILTKAAEKQGESVESEKILEAYKIASEEPEKYERYMEKLGNLRGLVDSTVNQLSYGKGYVQDAYIGLQNAFNQAYEAANYLKERGTGEEKEKAAQSLQTLGSLREQIAPLTTLYEKDPYKLAEFSKVVGKAIRRLNSVAAPQTFRPLEEFAIDKASDTFSNVAFNAYSEFAHKKPQNTAPIISIENPPVGMGLSRGEDLKNIVEASQKKFVKRATEELGLSEAKAKEEAKKLIGVTWDVGHINMMRKYGYEPGDVVKETEKVAPFVKHVHLSDNFGLEHTELPMGMGNVPIKQHEEALKKEMGEKFSKIKHIVETGSWFQDFKTTPLAETFEAFGSGIYPMKMASYWNATRGTGGGYFGGYGRMLPDNNFGTYGSGFSSASLPTELGGTMPGGRNRLSGAPVE